MSKWPVGRAALGHAAPQREGSRAPGHSLRRRPLAAAVAASSLLVVAACSYEPVTPASIAGADQIVLDSAPSSARSIGEYLHFVAKVVDKNGMALTEARLAWSSSDTTVMVSDGYGRFRTTGNGTAAAIVGLLDSPSFPKRVAQVVVRQVPDHILFATDIVVFYARGQSTRVDYRVLDRVGSPVVDTTRHIWLTANPSVAGVDGTGLVSAKGDGEVAIALQVGPVTEFFWARVASTVRFGGCATSSDAGTTKCNKVSFSVSTSR